MFVLEPSSFNIFTNTLFIQPFITILWWSSTELSSSTLNIALSWTLVTVVSTVRLASFPFLPLFFCPSRVPHLFGGKSVFRFFFRIYLPTLMSYIIVCLSICFLYLLDIMFLWTKSNLMKCETSIISNILLPLWKCRFLLLLNDFPRQRTFTSTLPISIRCRSSCRGDAMARFLSCIPFS